MKSLLIAAALMLAAPVPAGAGEERIVAADGAALDRDGLALRLSGADVVVLGEIHDNPVHHLNQAWAVARLAPDGLVVEMLHQADDDRIRNHLAAGGAPDGIGPLVGWEESGWPDWDLYAPIFRALPPGARIAGAAVPRDRARRVMTDSAAQLIDDPRLVSVLERRLDPVLQTELQREMIDAHCGRLPVDMAPMMVEVQRLRDANLAAAVLRLRGQGAARIVVITGNGHARTDTAVPAMLAAVAPGLSVVSLGQIEIGGDDRTDPRRFDLVWYTARHPRPDPCDAVRRRGG